MKHSESLNIKAIQYIGRDCTVSRKQEGSLKMGNNITKYSKV